MDANTLSDDEIRHLLSMPKIVVSKKILPKVKAKHQEQNIEVKSIDGRYSFTLFTRQSTIISESYTAGLIWHSSSNHRVILTRYNGSDHDHRNPLESEEFSSSCHIHVTTERYISAGRKPEMYATPTDRYTDINGAFGCLILDCNITFPQSPDIPGTLPQGQLF